MKKVLLFASTILMTLAVVSMVSASPKTKCYGDCNKEKRSCENKAKNTKYNEKDGFKKALDACQKTSDECSAKCKDVK